MAFAEQFIYLFSRHLMVSPSGLVPESLVAQAAAQTGVSEHTAADHANERSLVRQVAELRLEEWPPQSRAVEKTEQRGSPCESGFRGYEDNWRTDRISGRASHHFRVARTAGVSESDPVGYVRA